MERLEQQADPDWRRVFSIAELRDIQVWFELTYFDESYRVNDPRVASLLSQGKNFSEEDKETLSAVESEILRRVIPEYRKFQDSGQVELCTSPFYHPILPLLLDPQAGRKANRAPGALRPRFQLGGGRQGPAAERARPDGKDFRQAAARHLAPRGRRLGSDAAAAGQSRHRLDRVRRGGAQPLAAAPPGARRPPGHRRPRRPLLPLFPQPGCRSGYSSATTCSPT